jgi:hypothetical protein
MAEVSKGKATQPNIVFILWDNLGWGEVGCYGGGVLRGTNSRRRCRNRQSQSNPAEGWDGASSASNIAAKATPNSSQNNRHTLSIGLVQCWGHQVHSLSAANRSCLQVKCSATPGQRT